MPAFDTGRPTMENRARAFRVYVAAAADPSEAARVRAVIAMLRARGFIVTSTWPDVVAAVGASNPRDASVVDRRQWSTQCLVEIDASDAVWALVPDRPVTTIGAWWECCYAYSTQKHLVISGDSKQSVFCALGIEFEGDHAVLAHLERLRDVDSDNGHEDLLDLVVGVPA